MTDARFTLFCARLPASVPLSAAEAAELIKSSNGIFEPTKTDDRNVLILAAHIPHDDGRHSGDFVACYFSDHAEGLEFIKNNS